VIFACGSAGTRPFTAGIAKARRIGESDPDRFRRWLAGVALVVGVVLVASIASVSLRRPSAGCTADLPQRLTDEDAGLSLCLPAHWR
jgi:hypothetical protein